MIAQIVTEGLTSWQTFILQAGAVWGPLAIAVYKQNATNKALKARITELERENDEKDITIEKQSAKISELYERLAGVGRKGI